MPHSFSSRLLDFPLFQGFSRLDILDIAEKVRFDFLQLQRSDALMRQDEECRSLTFLLRGGIWVIRESFDHRFTLRERGNGPVVLQPEVLFGLHNRYSRSVVAAEDGVQVLRLDKETARELLLTYPVFQFNFYNLVCSSAQTADRQLWNSRKQELTDRFASFIRRRCWSLTGYKVLEIRMVDLAEELGVTRLSVSEMLNMMQYEGRVKLGRGSIALPEFERLL